MKIGVIRPYQWYWTRVLSLTFQTYMNVNLVINYVAKWKYAKNAIAELIDFFFYFTFFSPFVYCRKMLILCSLNIFLCYFVLLSFFFPFLFTFYVTNFFPLKNVNKYYRSVFCLLYFYLLQTNWRILFLASTENV